jgi:hypothetical protein
MNPRKQAIQGELFGLSEVEHVRQQIRELDSLIAKAVKQKEFLKAKELTEKQEALLQKLVEKKGN